MRVSCRDFVSRWNLETTHIVNCNIFYDNSFINLVSAIFEVTYQHKAWIISVSPTKRGNGHFWRAILMYNVTPMMGVATQHQPWLDQFKQFVWHLLRDHIPTLPIGYRLRFWGWSVNTSAFHFCFTVQRKMLKSNIDLKSKLLRELHTMKGSVTWLYSPTIATTIATNYFRTCLHSQSHHVLTNGYSIYWPIKSLTRVFEFSTD